MSMDISGPQLPAPGPLEHATPARGFPITNAPEPTVAQARDDAIDRFFRGEDQAPLQPAPSVLLRRRSVRHFLSTELTQHDVNATVQMAAWAPSGGNEQPWKVSALSPDRTEAFLAKTEARTWAALVPKLHAVAARRFQRDISFEESEDVVRNMIASDGTHKGRPWMLVVHYAPTWLPRTLWRAFVRAIYRPLYGGSRLAALRDLFTVHARVDPAVNEHSAVMFLYALALSATERGFGSCIQYLPRAFPKRLRKVARIPRRHVIVGTVLIGHTDHNSPAVQNALSRAQRETVPVTWST